MRKRGVVGKDGCARCGPHNARLGDAPAHHGVQQGGLSRASRSTKDHDRWGVLDPHTWKQVRGNTSREAFPESNGLSDSGQIKRERCGVNERVHLTQ